MAMHLFIDTNAYLSFSNYTKDDITALDKLFQELSQGNVVLHVPRQVRDEWTRNRDTRLSTAAKEFQKIPFSNEVPRHMQGLSMAESYSKAIAEAKKAREILIAEANLKARTYQLDVDIYIKSLFDVGEEYDHDAPIFAAGQLRADRGNPPGKPGSFGDQYNWEMLLTRVPDVDLYIVTKDSDYMSALEGKDEGGMTYPNAFRREEWSEKKDGRSLYVFDSLKAVLAHYEKTIAVKAAPPSEVKFELDLTKIQQPRDDYAQFGPAYPAAKVSGNESESTQNQGGEQPQGEEKEIEDDGLMPAD
ncbi:PIN domain-containing protein [Paraburkholderia nemoris]|uniref:PIN domain-containing protein n=1 Tax=Paraburkholderia nemoris TaxID=2793076 RepID=UPI0038BD13A1